MYIVKPSWLCHSDEQRKFEVYSVTVSPDNQRVATGGLDGKVRIWSAQSIRDSLEGDNVKSAPSNEPGAPAPGAKQLCSMATHNGAVTVVRFSPDGKYLATGSDDRVVLVWERDATKVPRKEFGSSGEADTESWIVRKRLAAHDNDIQDLAWAPDSSILVTVGLDSGVIVWSGTTFEKIQRLDAHQSHVKGITFDPANKFFATASDDRTVQIFRYNRASATDVTFSTEATITSPFKQSPLSTYFRRCSWSPDGNHIAAANATNGPVSVVAIINRGSWDSDISLIGHEAPCEVAAFCPRIFSRTKEGAKKREKKKGDDQSNAIDVDGEPEVNETVPITVIASAGQDKTLTIWNTSNPRPVVVCNEMALKTITDLAWANDGLSLYVTSLDGSISLVQFEDGELGYVVPMEENENRLTRYGGGKEAAQIPESVEQLVLEEKVEAKEVKDSEKRMEELMGAGAGSAAIASGAAVVPSPASTVTATAAANRAISPAVQAVTATISTPTTPPAKPAKQKVTITKDGRKRVAPQLLTTTSSTVQATLPAATTVSGATASTSATAETLPVNDFSKPSYALPKGGVSTLVIGSKRRSDDLEDGSNGIQTALKKSKPEDDVPEYIAPVVVSPATTTSQVRLGAPKVRNLLMRSMTLRDSDSPRLTNESVALANGDGSSLSKVPHSFNFEVRNGSGNDQQPTKVSVTRNSQTVFVDFVPYYVHLIAGNGCYFWATSAEDGSIVVYSPTGRRMLPPLVTGSPLSFLESQNEYLLAITSVGVLHLWNVVQRKAVFPPVSLAPILDSGSRYEDGGVLRGPHVTQCGVTGSGRVIITLSTGCGYTYDEGLRVWCRLSEPWWATGSQYWSATQLLGEDAAKSRWVLAVEERTAEESQRRAGGRGRYLKQLTRATLNREGFEGMEGVVSIAHLENRIAAAEMLESKHELRTFIVMYARRIAEEGLRSRVDELCRELLGPGQAQNSNWSPQVCGLDKHELLKEVVLKIGKYRESQRVAVVYGQAIGLLEDEVLGAPKDDKENGKEKGNDEEEDEDGDGDHDMTDFKDAISEHQ